MNTFFTLIKGEARRNANWFKENTMAKIFVIIGFLTVALGLIFGEYKITWAYLAFANEYAPFGPPVAVYSLKVAVFLLFILATISSTAISSSILYRNMTLRHLFTMPIKSMSIFMSRVIPGWISSTMILLLLIPVLLVYDRILFRSENFVIIAGMGLLILSIVSQSLGIMFSTFFAYFLGKITRQKWLAILAVLLIGFVTLTRILFPADMFNLAKTDNFAAFQDQIDSLPLAGSFLPTNWLVDGLSGNLNMLSVLSTVFIVLCLLIIIKIIGEKYYLTAWRRSQDQSYLAGNSGTKNTLKTYFPKFSKSKSVYWPLIINDLLSFVRSNAEVNYSLFLGGLLAILIYSVNNLTKLTDTTPRLLMAVYLIAFVSITLIFLISATRLIYPMMAKEKLTSWFSFSLPISREKFLKEKLLVSIILVIPGVVASILIVWGLRLPSNMSLVMILLMFATIMSINVLQCLMGSINPNFEEAENPEAVSTSGLGILSLVISLGLIVFSTIQLNNYLLGNIDGFELALRWILMTVVIVAPVLLVATKSIQKYSF